MQESSNVFWHSVKLCIKLTLSVLGHSCRHTNCQPWLVRRCCCWWPVRRVMFTRLRLGNCSRWSPVRQEKHWSRHVWTLQTRRLVQTHPLTNVWVPLVLRKRTLPTRCLRQMGCLNQRWALLWCLEYATVWDLSKACRICVFLYSGRSAPCCMVTSEAVN